jgi:Bifunctional DNA primase/polymerase, N-terminal
MTVAEHAALKAATTLPYPAFPCLASKAPACPRGFKAAIMHDAGLATLWARYPGVLIGVPTGAISGFDVLDVDPKNEGGAWYQANRSRLPATRIHRTRSGGLHVLLKHCDGLRNSSSKIAPGIDVRAVGGYVIWWPAEGLPVREHPLDALPEWPLWLLPALMSPPKPPPPVYPKPAVPCAPDAVLRPLGGVLRKVAFASQGERNALLFWGACRLRDMALEGKIALPTGNELLAEAALRTGLQRLEVERTIASAQKSAVRHG